MSAELAADIEVNKKVGGNVINGKGLNINSFYGVTDVITIKSAVSLIKILKSGDTNPFNDGSLVSSYLFNDNPDDLLGNYNGTVTTNAGGTTTGVYQAGIFDKSLKIANTKVAVGNTAPLSEFSYSVWLKTNTTPSLLNRYIIDDTSGRAILAETTTDGAVMAIFDGASWIYTGYNLPIGVWTYITLTKKGTSWKFYVDGVINFSFTGNDVIISGDRFLGGGRASMANAAIDGNLDQFMIFNKELSQEEITQLFKMEA